MYETNKKFYWHHFIDPEKTFPLRDVQAQLQSPLFGVLPPEIRRMIFTFTLTDYERTILSADGKRKKLYFHHRIHEHTRRTDTELLRTCKRVFQETWFMPFAFAKHGLVDPFFNYLCWKERQMNFTGEAIGMRLTIVKHFADSHRLGSYLPQINGFQLFLGSAELDEASAMELYPQVVDDIITLQEHRPKIITITIDYVKNSPKFIEAKWVNEVRFSPAVKTIEVEFRSLRIHKYILALIAYFVANNWFFRREDGAVFKPVTIKRSLKYLAGSDDPKKEHSVWKERVGGPGKYYSLLINTVTWKPTPGFDPFTDGYECPDLDLRNHRFVFPRDFESLERPCGMEVL
ncbi:hypothetical protein EIK77_009845 [Talaromyces pinophilus]|nr:hypothetical protein EIK77_009845 [Talaromyces pinophilus]